MNREDWVISYDIQQAIQQVASLTWSLSNKTTLKTRAAEELAAFEDAEVELTGPGCFLKCGDAFELVEDETGALDFLSQKQAEATELISGLSKMITRETEELETVKNMVTKQLGDKVQLNMH